MFIIINNAVMNEPLNIVSYSFKDFFLSCEPFLKSLLDLL